MKLRRVAFFTDSFHEVNGVALTSREFVAFAKRRSIPMLAVHAGPRTAVHREGPVTTIEFERGAFRWRLEHDLSIDLLFFRYWPRIRAAPREFKPDLIHITGPGDAGILGAFAAWKLGLPLAASWHTNLHEFASRRLARAMHSLPSGIAVNVANWVERRVFERCVWFYGLAKVLFAPNPDLVDMLALHTSRPVFLMRRGIDGALFSPARRMRTDRKFVIGYVGRVSPEKNVRMLATLEASLAKAGVDDYKILVVGEGSERAWLAEHLRSAELPGVLKGVQLAEAYACMDILIFPSDTDTFGNVVLEAMSSGVPVIVSASGGPKFLVEHGVTGYVAGSEEEFASSLLGLYRDREKLLEMSKRAREAAGRYSWETVFTDVYTRYDASSGVSYPSGAARSLTFA